jgi:hypothetical protein
MISSQTVKLLDELRKAEYWRDNDRDPDGVVRAEQLIHEIEAELDRLMDVATRVA